MLRYFIRKARRQGLGVKPRVLVAVPGCITPVEKRAVYNSAQRAGAREVFVMSEAKAAAIGAGLPIAEPVASMICDIGGGTTEVAVLSLGDIVASQSIRVAGDAMDQAIVDYLQAALQPARRHGGGRAAADRDRQRLSAGRGTVDEVRGVDTISGLPRKATITSEEVREALGRAAGANRRRHQGHARRLQRPTWPPIWSTTAWCWPAADRCCADSIAS